jgi:hypothetical protein
MYIEACIELEHRRKVKTNRTVEIIIVPVKTAIDGRTCRQHATCAANDWLIVAVPKRCAPRSAVASGPTIGCGAWKMQAAVKCIVPARRLI